MKEFIYYNTFHKKERFLNWLYFFMFITSEVDYLRSYLSGFYFWDKNTFQSYEWNIREWRLQVYIIRINNDEGEKPPNKDQMLLELLLPPFSFYFG